MSHLVNIVGYHFKTIVEMSIIYKKHFSPYLKIKMVFSARVDFYYINNNSFLRIQRYCGEAKIATRICNVNN